MTKMDQGELRELIKLMKENRVDRFKVGDIEVHFAPQAFIPVDLSEQVTTQLTPEQKQKEDDEVLFYSAR